MKPKPNRPPRPQTPVLSPKPTAADLMAFQLELRKYDRALSRWEKRLAQWEQELEKREQELAEDEHELFGDIGGFNSDGDIEETDDVYRMKPWPKDAWGNPITPDIVNDPGFGIPSDLLDDETFPCGCTPEDAESDCGCVDCNNYLTAKHNRVQDIMKKVRDTADEFKCTCPIYKLNGELATFEDHKNGCPYYEWAKNRARVSAADADYLEKLYKLPDNREEK